MALNLYAERLSADALERERLATQAKIVDENLGHQLLATNRALDSIRSDLPYLQAQKDARALINNRLMVMREAMPGTRAITLLAADGTLTARSPDQFTGQNFSSRDYFQIPRKGANVNQLYVAPPFLAATGEYVLNMSKIVSDDKGRFAGVILASLDPQYFSVLLDSIRYAPDMWASLAHGDGNLFLLIPARFGAEGSDLAKPGSFYSRHLASGQTATLMTGGGQAASEQRMVAVRTIKPTGVPMDKALVLFVSRDLTSVFAPWRKHVYEQLALSFLLIAAAVLGLYLYQRRQLAYDLLVHAQEVERKRTEMELHIAAAAFDSQQAMMITDANNVILRVNRAFTEDTGYAPEDAIGQSPRLLKSGRHNASFYHDMWESIRSNGTWQGEIWDKRKSGEEFLKWLTISAVVNADGVLTNYVGAHYDITERKKAEERIEDLAFFDQLTGLPNRTLLLDRLRQAKAASSRSGSYGALLFIDLDNFKTLNDTLGHDQGDQLLKQVAQRLSLCVREDDTVARVGGDEYVVILAGLGVKEEEAATAAEAVAEKILASLKQFYRLGSVQHQNTASIGVTLFKGDTASSEDLMKQADMAMYKAKEAGRNTVRFFNPTLESAVKERATLESDLRQAIHEEQFQLHYQAQVLGEGQLTGVEALIRWRHPQRGMVAPGEFIPLAEETGLILPLGYWVLTAACAQLVAWAKQPGLAHLTVAINVSAIQFRQDNFVEQVGSAIATTGANPQRLKLELTESLLVSDVEDVIEKMYALKAKGVSFSLDDFGTGYSSLAYLKRLPLDQLKIDQSFVHDVLSDPNDATIARTIIALAQSFGLAVIAEGVETRLQRDFLAAAGCHAYQGYHFARPMPVEAFEEQAKLGFGPR